MRSADGGNLRVRRSEENSCFPTFFSHSLFAILEAAVPQTQNDLSPPVATGHPKQTKPFYLYLWRKGLEAMRWKLLIAVAVVAFLLAVIYLAPREREFRWDPWEAPVDLGSGPVTLKYFPIPENEIKSFCVNFAIQF
jgi:hypothetical protein